MNLLETGIQDLYVIEPKIYEDSRGYFYESFSLDSLTQKSLNYNFIQDNESYSKYGTIRGLHYQRHNFSQAKLVRVVVGEVLDVVVDLRKESKTFGNKFEILLNEKNKKQLLVPRGFAHGFSVLSSEAIFQYKVDNIFNKDAETGIIYNDKFLAIDWRVPVEDCIVSDKDQLLKDYNEAIKEL